MSSEKPQNVGILALEIYFPKTYISQEEFEAYNQVSSGKYTIGLGQLGLAYVDDREDLYSIALTAVSNLLKKYKIDPKSIGRLEVATETIMDHSKAAKTVLMQLFQEFGNTDIEGIDCMNACYAGTNALFNSVAWIESSAWDGRYALVVAGDIAEYAEGPARPTGGCGCVAMLIGPNAPIVLHPARGSHFEHTYDFYKPDPTSPYPVVDGKFSNSCYLRSLDSCFQSIANKFQKKTGEAFSVDRFDYCLFHAPYNKLVQKAFGRLLFNEFHLAPSKEVFASVQQFKDIPREKTYDDVTLEKAFVELSRPLYKQKVAPSTLLPQQLGNLYTGSLYAGLCSLVYQLPQEQEQKEQQPKNVLLFSYGSGSASSMFIFTFNNSNSKDSKFTLSNIRDQLDLEKRLASRVKTACERFTQIMKLREELHKVRGSYTPKETEPKLFDGTSYLKEKDENGRRYYDVYRAPEAERS